MSIKKENSLTEKITAKGQLENITEEGFEIMDEKTGEIDVITFDELKSFIGDTPITFQIGYKKQNKTKESSKAKK